MNTILLICGIIGAIICVLIICATILAGRNDESYLHGFTNGYMLGYEDGVKNRTRFTSDDISGFTNAINFSVRVRYGD